MAFSLTGILGSIQPRCQLAYLFRRPADGMYHLVIRLAVLQLRLKQQRPRVVFLSGCQISLRAEGSSSQQFLLQHPAVFRAKGQDFF